MDNPVEFFLFLSLFELIGVSMMAASLRQMIAAPISILTRLPPFLFGGFFLVIPLLIGFIEQDLLFLGGQIVLAAVIFAAVFIWWPRLQRLINQPYTMPMFMGGLFVIVGLGAFGGLFRQGELLPALFAGLIFTGLGGFVFWTGLKTLLGGDDARD